MKCKTSVTLSEDLVAAVDEITPEGGSRSETIERLLRESFQARERRAQDIKDLDVINGHADELNAEAEDVLTYLADV
jgi:metal-responsive CopG/Arc/MetJ family transcriptional regulator